MNREEWLNTFLKKLYPHFKDQGFNVPPNIRVSVGFPSKGVKSKTIGECWDSECSNDQQFEIFIHPNQDNAVKVGGILVHEIAHAVVGIDAKHGPEFKACALKVGLCGKMKSTEETPELLQKLEAIVKEIGPYPHSKLILPPKAETPKANGPIKAVCPTEECGYHVRISPKWVEEKGFPVCPCGEQMEEGVKKE